MASYDVIVIGARVAGATTAMLLARRGLKVLVVDQVSFPHDTISSHQVQVPGIALLNEWGLLDRLNAAGTPLTRRVRFDSHGILVAGSFPQHGGVEAMCSPRRTLLDALLVDAARAAGAEVREHVRVEELAWSGATVTGIRGLDRSNRAVVESARLVVGADGKHSLVASQVNAARYHERPVRAFACYSYWSGPGRADAELYQRPGRAVAVFPTNDDLTMIYVAAPLAEFAVARRDLEKHYLATLDECGDLGERVRASERAERIRTTPDQPNMFRVSNGAGWALVGDAGVVMDSISAQGITNALQDAQSLADAVVIGFGVGGSLPDALGEHQRQRDRKLKPMYDFTTRLARFAAQSPIERALLTAIARRPAESDRFLGAFAGITPIDEYFSPRNAFSLIGPLGLMDAGLQTARQLTARIKRSRLE